MEYMDSMIILCIMMFLFLWFVYRGRSLSRYATLLFFTQDTHQKKLHPHVCRHTDSDNQNVRSLSCGQCMTLRKHLAEEHGHGEPWQVVMPRSERMNCDFCWWKMVEASSIPFLLFRTWNWHGQESLCRVLKTQESFGLIDGESRKELHKTMGFYNPNINVGASYPLVN